MEVRITSSKIKSVPISLGVRTDQMIGQAHIHGFLCCQFELHMLTSLWINLSGMSDRTTTQGFRPKELLPGEPIHLHFETRSIRRWNLKKVGELHLARWVIIGVEEICFIKIFTCIPLYELPQFDQVNMIRVEGLHQVGAIDEQCGCHVSRNFCCSVFAKMSNSRRIRHRVRSSMDHCPPRQRHARGRTAAPCPPGSAPGGRTLQTVAQQATPRPTPPSAPLGDVRNGTIGGSGPSWCKGRPLGHRSTCRRCQMTRKARHASPATTTASPVTSGTTRWIGKRTPCDPAQRQPADGAAVLPRAASRRPEEARAAPWMPVGTKQLQSRLNGMNSARDPAAPERRLCEAKG